MTKISNEERAINVLVKISNKILSSAEFSLAFNSILDAYLDLDMRIPSQVYRVEAYYSEYFFGKTEVEDKSYENIFSSESKL